MTLLLLLMRFVQPEIIYVVRRGLVMVGINKAFLDKLAGREDVDARYKQLLVQETRYETRTRDEALILQDRVIKISELYRLLDLRRKLIRSQKPQVCIVELGTLLANLGNEIEANPEHNAPAVKAGALLKYIANGVRKSQNEPLFVSEDQIDEWLIEYPISIEQVIELLLAAVVGLAHRQQATKLDTEVKRPQRVAVLSEINKLEKRVRLLVRAQLQSKYVSEDAIDKRVRESLGDESYQECLRRMEQVRRDGPGLALDFFDFVYWRQLETLMVKEWPVFGSAFETEEWLRERIDTIIEVRDEEANQRPVSDDVKKRALQYCSEVRMRIENFNDPRA